MPRATRLQALSTANKTRFHLPDGPEQRRATPQMAAGATDWSFDAVAWIYGHDAARVIDDEHTTPKPSTAAEQ